MREIDDFQQRHRPLAFGFAVVKKYGDDDGGRLGGLIAFYGFFSLFPLLLVFVSALGFVLGSHPHLRQTIVDSALGQFPVIGPSLASRAHLHGLEGNWLSIVIGSVTALWAGLGVAQSAQVAMNTVWDVPRAQWPNFLSMRIRAIGMLALLGTLTIASTFVTGYGSSGVLDTAWWHALAWLVGLALNVVLFTLAYQVLTARDLRWRNVLPGAVTAAVLWTALQNVGGYYVTHQLKSASDVYGTFALVIALLVWISLGAQVTLFCAEINVVRCQRLWPRSLVQPPLNDGDRRVYTAIVERARMRPEMAVNVSFTGNHEKGARGDSGAEPLSRRRRHGLVITGDEPEAAPREHWIALTVVCLSVLVIVLDNTILNVALPSIERSLHASSSQLQWTVDAYTLVFASLLLTAGTLGDRHGRRGTLMTGLAIFGIGSGLAAFAPSAPWLIAFRSLMGFGAAAIFPTTLSIITNMFEGAERGRAIGIWAALSGVGVALGPIVGGVMLDHWWWGSVLLVNLPIVALSLILLPLLVPTSKEAHAPPVDPPGAVLSVAGLTALLYGIIQAPHDGWGSATVTISIAAGIALLALFTFNERRSEHPMLQLSFFRNARFSAASIALSLTFFGLFGYIFLLTQYLQFVRGLSPLGAGIRLAPPAVGLAIGAPIAPRIVERIGTKIVVTVGLSVATAALLLLTRTTVLAHDAWLAPSFMLFGFGMGLTMAPATESIMGSVPRNRAGVGSAVNDTTRQTGGALGVAVLGSLFATKYNASIDHLHLPAKTAGVARQSIGAALQLAQKLPASERVHLVQSAQHGFLEGIQLATFAGAAVVACAAVVVACFLPARGDDS